MELPFGQYLGHEDFMGNVVNRFVNSLIGKCSLSYLLNILVTIHLSSFPRMFNIPMLQYVT
jgi:hypothetical protein